MTEQEKDERQELSIHIQRLVEKHPHGAPKNYVPPLPIPNCPKCNSNFVFRLTFLDHLRIICDKGLSARDFDKTYECHRCGHKW